jgi:hypothetical protein
VSAGGGGALIGIAGIGKTAASPPTGAAAVTGGAGAGAEAGGGAAAACNVPPTAPDSSDGAAAVVGGGFCCAAGAATNGTVASANFALARSANSLAATPPRTVGASDFGFGGTLARFGYGASAFGGGGRASAIGPPSRSCHQSTGFIDAPDEHPASTMTTPTALQTRKPRTAARRSRS